MLKKNKILLIWSKVLWKAGTRLSLSILLFERWFLPETLFSPGVRSLQRRIKSQRGPMILRACPFCGLGQGASALGASVSPSVKWGILNYLITYT